jgi:hypothetical protein
MLEKFISQKNVRHEAANGTNRTGGSRGTHAGETFRLSSDIKKGGSGREDGNLSENPL